MEKFGGSVIDFGESDSVSHLASCLESLVLPVATMGCSGGP